MQSRNKENENKQLKIMQKLIKLFQLVLAGSALICTLALSIVNFQPTICYLLVSGLFNSLVGALVWLSFKELKNEE